MRQVYKMRAILPPAGKRPGSSSPPRPGYFFAWSPRSSGAFPSPYRDERLRLTRPTPRIPVASSARLAGSGVGTTATKSMGISSMNDPHNWPEQDVPPGKASVAVSWRVLFEQGATLELQGLSPRKASRFRARTSKLLGSRVHEIEVISAAVNKS